MTQDIEKYVEEFARYYGHNELVSVEDTKHENGVDWVEDALTKVAEEARKEERERITAWAEHSFEVLLIHLQSDK